jgi:hypothetical protein
MFRGGVINNISQFASHDEVIHITYKIIRWRSTSFNYNVSKCIGPTLSHKTMWRSNHQQLGGRLATQLWCLKQPETTGAMSQVMSIKT